MRLFERFFRAAMAGVLVTLAGCGGGGAGATGAGGGSGGGGTTPAPSATSRISIDRTRTGQTISGWEVTPRFWEFDKVNNRYDGSWLASRDAIVQKLVDDAGITRVRLELRSGVENPVDYWTQFVNGQLSYTAGRDHYYDKINDNADPNVANAAGFQWSSFDYYVENFLLPMRARMAARNEKLFVSLCLVDFNWTAFKGTLSLSGNANEYAELVTQAAMRLRDKYGVTLDALEIILEPDNGDGWTGAAIGRAMLAAKSRLAAAGLGPKIIAPSASTAGGTIGFLDGIGTVAGANAALNTVSYHRYDGASADQSLSAIRQRAAALGADTAMLEYVDASVENFFRDMAFGGASAWQGYSVAKIASTASEVGSGAILWRNPAGALALTPQFSRMALVQREVRPGARAHPATATLGNDMALDFDNPDGSEVIAVYSASGSTVEISGAGHTAYTVTFAGPGGAAFTSSVANASGGVVQVAIPAGTVAVLHSTN